MEVIHTYTRKEAIEDGVLIDATKLASEAGLQYPTAVTAAVWEKYVAVPEGVELQCETGRLWDIVWMLCVAVSKSNGDGTELLFQLYVQNDSSPASLVTLKAVCGPGDNLEPVLTIMLPHED